jgi:hypothetical protein
MAASMTSQVAPMRTLRANLAKSYAKCQHVGKKRLFLTPMFP